MKKISIFFAVLFILEGMLFSLENQAQARDGAASSQEEFYEGERQSPQPGSRTGVKSKRRAGGYYGAGRRAYKRRDFLKAAKWFLRATKLNYSKAKYHYYLGKSYYHLKKYESSFKALKAAVAIDAECRFSKNPSNFKKMYKKIEKLSSEHGDSLFTSYQGSEPRQEMREEREEGRQRRGGLSTANKIGIGLLIFAAILALIYFIRKKRNS